jgi:hypothetical protein
MRYAAGSRGEGAKPGMDLVIWQHEERLKDLVE